jgi:hypothetical protein
MLIGVATSGFGAFILYFKEVVLRAYDLPGQKWTQRFYTKEEIWKYQRGGAIFLVVAGALVVIAASYCWITLDG